MILRDYDLVLALLKGKDNSTLGRRKERKGEERRGQGREGKGKGGEGRGGEGP